MISIGAIYHGPELEGSAIHRRLMLASKIIKESRASLGETPWVNAVFVVSGSLETTDFDGLKFGDHSKKDKGIVVQIAVPPEVVQGTQQAEFIIDSLHGANAMAFEFFRTQGEQFPLKDAEELVRKVALRLANG